LAKTYEERLGASVTTLLGLIDRAPLAVMLAALMLLTFVAYILLSTRIRLTTIAVLTILPLAPILILRFVAAAIVARCDRFLHVSKLCAPARRRARWLDREYNPDPSPRISTGETEHDDQRTRYLQRAHVALASRGADIARRIVQHNRVR
jgi:hypothetical protein